MTCPRGDEAMPVPKGSLEEGPVISEEELALQNEVANIAPEKCYCEYS